jgi:hypothetical protein
LLAWTGFEFSDIGLHKNYISIAAPDGVPVGMRGITKVKVPELASWPSMA